MLFISKYDGENERGPKNLTTAFLSATLSLYATNLEAQQLNHESNHSEQYNCLKSENCTQEGYIREDSRKFYIYHEGRAIDLPMQMKPIFEQVLAHVSDVNARSLFIKLMVDVNAYIETKNKEDIDYAKKKQLLRQYKKTEQMLINKILQAAKDLEEFIKYQAIAFSVSRFKHGAYNLSVNQAEFVSKWVSELNKKVMYT